MSLLLKSSRSFLAFIALTRVTFSFAEGHDFVVECTTPPGALSSVKHEGINRVAADLVMHPQTRLSQKYPRFSFNQPLFNDLPSGCLLRSSNSAEEIVLVCDSEEGPGGSSARFTHSAHSMRLDYQSNVQGFEHFYTLTFMNRAGVREGSLKNPFLDSDPNGSYECRLSTK